MVITIGAAPGCLDRSTMFEGLWISVDDVELGWIDGQVELAIGHFGAELTGVVYFLESDGIQPDSDCGCRFIDNKSTNLDAQTFVATITDCDGEILGLMLALDDSTGDETQLTGTLLDTVTQTSVDVTFVQQDEFITDARKVCP